MSNATKARTKFNGYAKWISIGLVVSVIVYNAITNVAIRRNELHHVLENQKTLADNIERNYSKTSERIERIEEYLWIK